jgi:hypothetical protein
MFEYASSFNQNLCSWQVRSGAFITSFCTNGASCGGCSWYEQGVEYLQDDDEGIEQSLTEYIVRAPTEAPTKSHTDPPTDPPNRGPRGP